MPTFLGQLGMQAASQGLGAGMGLLFQGMQDRRQLNMQRRLQRMEMEGSKEMSDYQLQNQLKLWDATNYSAQMNQLKKAGLNPGLIYGMGGAGGATAQANAGHVTAGQAPKGGGEAIAGMGMGMNLALQKAQIDNLNSQSELNRTEAQKRAGIDTEEGKARITGINQSITESIARIAKIGQEMKNLQAQEKLTNLEAGLKELQTKYDAATLNDRISLINTSLKHAQEALAIIENDRDISDETKQTQINQIKADYFKTLAETALIKAQTSLTQEETRKVGEQIKQIWQDIYNGKRALDLQSRKISDDWYNARDKATEPDRDPVLSILDQLGVFIPIPGVGSKPTPMRGLHDRKNR